MGTFGLAILHIPQGCKYGLFRRQKSVWLGCQVVCSRPRSPNCSFNFLPLTPDFKPSLVPRAAPYEQTELRV